jgi:hypothetical protein
MPVRVQDILFRAGGATLKRLQTLVSAGAGRTEVAHTYARATVKRAFRDRDGNAKRAGAGFMGLDWPSGLVDADGNATGGPLSEGARTQLVTDPENFGAWSVIGTPILTGGQADPFGGTGAYLVEDNDAAGFEHLQTPGDTAITDGERSFALFVKQGTASVSWVRIRGAAERHRVLITWSAGVPALSTSSGAGTLHTVEAWGNGWYRIAFSATGVVGADSNVIEFGPGTFAASATGTGYFFGANAWNAPFPQSYQAPGDGTGVADALTSPFNFGPQDITVLVRLGRPQHADAGASTALGVSPGIFSFGAGSAARIGAYFDPAARNIIGVIDTATTDRTVSAAIPAGNPTVAFQFKNLTTGGQVAIDTGSGLSAFSSAATAFSAFSSQTVRLGRYDDELYGVIGDLIVARGLFSRSDMLTIP